MSLIGTHPARDFQAARGGFDRILNWWTGELARIVGVSPTAVSKACRGILKQAVRSGRILVDHPATQHYMTSRDVAERRRVAQGNQRRHRPAGPASG